MSNPRCCRGQKPGRPPPSSLTKLINHRLPRILSILWPNRRGNTNLWERTKMRSNRGTADKDKEGMALERLHIKKKQEAHKQTSTNMEPTCRRSTEQEVTKRDKTRVKIFHQMLRKEIKSQTTYELLLQ